MTLRGKGIAVCSEPTVLVRQGKNNVARGRIVRCVAVATSRTIRKARTVCKKIALVLANLHDEPTVLVRQGKNNVARGRIVRCVAVATSRTIRKARTVCKKIALVLANLHDEPTVLVRQGKNKNHQNGGLYFWWPWSDCNSHPKSNQSRLLLVILVGPFHCAANELPLVPNRRFSSDRAKIKTTKMVVYIFGGPGRTRTDTPCRT